MGMFNVTSMGGKMVMAAGNEEQTVLFQSAPEGIFKLFLPD